MMRYIIIHILSIILSYKSLAQTNMTQLDNIENNGAVVFLYHHFDQPHRVNSNIDSTLFSKQLKYLRDNSYNILPLAEIMRTLKDKKQLPEKTVAITIDNIHRNIYDKILPILIKYDIPFSLFVTTGIVGAKDYMDWIMLKDLVARAPKGTSIESQSLSYNHLLLLNTTKINDEMRISYNIINKNIGVAPKFYAFPYGEASLQIMDLAKDNKYLAAFGQHSGVVSSFTTRYYLPRFSINNTYGQLDKFILRAQAKPLIVTDLIPNNPYLLPKDIEKKSLGFNVVNKNINVDKINCYQSSLGKITQKYVIGDSRLELRLSNPFTQGKNRINCTYYDKNWYWFGMMYHASLTQ